MYWVETFFYTQNIKLWSGRGLQMLSDASLEPSLGHHTCLRHHRCLLSIILEAYFTFSEKKKNSVSLPLALENLLKLEFHLRSFFLYYLWWTFMESIHALCEHFHTEILRLSLSPHFSWLNKFQFFSLPSVFSLDSCTTHRNSWYIKLVTVPLLRYLLGVINALDMCVLFYITVWYFWPAVYYCEFHYKYAVIFRHR